MDLFIKISIKAQDLNHFKCDGRCQWFELYLGNGESACRLFDAKIEKDYRVFHCVEWEQFGFFKMLAYGIKTGTLGYEIKRYIRRLYDSLIKGAGDGR
jgi:hypothetical protein